MDGAGQRNSDLPMKLDCSIIVIPTDVATRLVRGKERERNRMPSVSTMRKINEVAASKIRPLRYALQLAVAKRKPIALRRDQTSIIVDGLAQFPRQA